MPLLILAVLALALAWGAARPRRRKDDGEDYDWSRL